MTVHVVVEENINICANVADHIFLQDIEDCRKYFVCVDGQPRAQQCKSGLYFDAHRQACIASQQGCLKCPSRQMLNMPLAKTCDKYIFCYYGQPSLMKCEENQQFNAKTGKCDLSRNVDCVENHCSIHTINNELVYVPSAASCEKYYICMSGQAKALTCAAGLYFSTKCNCCDRSENVQCSIEDTDTTPPENSKEKRYFNNYSNQLPVPTLIGEINTINCPTYGVFVYQYIEDPEKYITCVDGKATLYACAAGYQFDDRQKRCVNNEPQFYIDSMSMDNDNLTNGTELIQCPEFGASILPHYQSSKYILCVNGNATVYDCPEDHYFDAEDNHCHSEEAWQRKKELSRYGAVVDEVAGIVCPKYATFTFPHVENDKFYLCLDGKATVFACAEGQYFDINEHGCIGKPIELELMENVEEEDTLNATKRLAGDQLEFATSPITVKCPPTGNTTLPHVLRNQYYVCREGIAVVFTCPQGLLYDGKLKTCTEHSANNEVYRPAVDSDAANIMCPKFGTFKFPHLNKTMYYLCTDGKTYILACGLNEIFDADINICREDETSLLEMTVANTTTPTLTMPVATEIASNIICPKFGTFIYPHAQRNRYYVCIDGNAIGFVCAEGQYFDTKTNACQRSSELDESEEEQQTPVILDEPVNILCPSVGAMKFAHEEKHKFYLCINGMASVLACANGSFFEAETGACRRTYSLEMMGKETVIDTTGNITNIENGTLQTVNFTVAENVTLETDTNSTVKCPFSGTFIYPHAENNQYYVCLEGKALVLSCPEGLVFDAKEKTCRTPDQSGSVETEHPTVLDEIVDIICPVSGAYKYPHIEKHKFYLCINGMASVLACANGSIFESETGDCRRTYSLEMNGNETVKATDNITNIENGTLQTVNFTVAENVTFETDTNSTVKCPLSGTFVYPHAEKNQYYVCLEGKALVLTCPEGLVFDAKEKTCVAPDKSGNVETEHPEVLDEIVDIICPTSGAYKYPHVEKYKFYLCINGMASVLACANGSIFESETGDCRRIYSLENNGNETVKDTGNITNIENGTLQPVNFTVAENVTLETDTNSTVECPLSGIFVYPHAEKNQYYVCLEGKALVLSCPEGLVFDAKEKTCRAPDQSGNVEIEHPKVLDEIVNIICPASGAYKYAHVEKHKFYLCVNGMASVLACPGKSIFDKETGSCLRKETAKLNTTLNSNETATTAMETLTFVSQESETIRHNSTLVNDDKNITDIEKDHSLNRAAVSGETSNITCPELGTFLYPHEERNKYFICLDGAAIEFTCAKGLIFDVTKNVCLEDPTLEYQDIKCPAQGTDMLPHKESNKFYLCIKGMAIIQSCAAGDFFDGETKTCRETQTIQSTLQQQQTVDVKCPLNGTSKLAHNDPNKFYLCLNGTITIHSCAKGDFFDAETETCRESQTQASSATINHPSVNINCPLKGTIKLAHVNPNKFYLCVDGLATTYSCAKGDYFDAETETCRESSLQTSTLLPIENTETEQTSSALCPPRGIALIPHTDSNKFYHCLDGVATLQSCAEGDYFDVETQTCSEPAASNMCPAQGSALIPHADSNKFYHCLDGVATLESCAEGYYFDVETQTCIESTASNMCPAKGTALIPHTTDSNKFYHCLDGVATLESCAEGDYFDVETQTCSEPTASNMCPAQGTALMPHTTDSNKFYHCLDGVATLESCAEGDYFDVETQTCREALNSVMPSIKCPERGIFVYPLPRKNTFYVCSDGKARAVHCAEGDIFDAEINACREVNEEESPIIANLTKNQENPKLDDKKVKMEEESEEPNATESYSVEDAGDKNKNIELKDVAKVEDDDDVLDNTEKNSEMSNKAAKDLPEKTKESQELSLNDNNNNNEDEIKNVKFSSLETDVVEFVEEIKNDNISDNSEKNSEIKPSEEMHEESKESHDLLEDMKNKFITLTTDAVEVGGEIKNDNISDNSKIEPSEKMHEESKESHDLLEDIKNKEFITLTTDAVEVGSEIENDNISDNSENNFELKHSEEMDEESKKSHDLLEENKSEDIKNEEFITLTTDAAEVVAKIKNDNISDNSEIEPSEKIHEESKESHDLLENIKNKVFITLTTDAVEVGSEIENDNISDNSENNFELKHSEEMDEESKESYDLLEENKSEDIKNEEFITLTTDAAEVVAEIKNDNISDNSEKNSEIENSEKMHEDSKVSHDLLEDIKNKEFITLTTDAAEVVAEIKNDNISDNSENNSEIEPSQEMHEESKESHDLLEENKSEDIKNEEFITLTTDAAEVIAEIKNDNISDNSEKNSGIEEIHEESKESHDLLQENMSEDIKYKEFITLTADAVQVLAEIENESTLDNSSERIPN